MARVNTTEYEFSHGRPPRGRGLWLFDFGGGVWNHYNGTYSEAKKFALRDARQQGLTEIKVLP